MTNTAPPKAKGGVSSEGSEGYPLFFLYKENTQENPGETQSGS